MPGLGLYLGTTALALSAQALQAGNNFRIKQRRVVTGNLGWALLDTPFPLNGPVIMIDNFFPAGAGELLLFGTLTDLYRYLPSTNEVAFLTPRYETGTASASGTAVTGVGTLWSTEGIAAGDFISFGSAGETDPTATWYEVDSVGGETSITLTTSAGTVAGGPYTIRKVFGATVAGGWQTEVFVNDGASGDDLWFATNGVDDVVTWNGTADQVTSQTGLGFTCETLRVYKNMMIYGNVVQGASDLPTSIINSDVGLPLAAGSAGSGLAGQFQVHAGTDEIMTMELFADNLILYSARHVVVAQFIDEPFVMAFRDASTSYGVLGPGAVADFGDYHRFVGQDAFYEFDGATLRRVDSHVWRDLIRTLDFARSFRIFGHFDEEQGDLIWSVPLTTDADAGDPDGQAESAFTAHYLEEVPPTVGMPHSKRDFPFLSTGYYTRSAGVTWNDLTSSWDSNVIPWDDKSLGNDYPQNLAGDKDGNVWVLNEVSTANGAAMTAFVRTGRIMSGSGREANLLTRVYSYLSPGSGTIALDVYGADHAAGTATILGSFTVDLALPEEGQFASVFRAAKFFEFEWRATGSSWVLHGWDTDIRMGGRR